MKAARLKQGGVVLVIALIALIAMTLAVIGLVRSTDTANVIAGNLAFRKAALQATDTGIEDAVSSLPGIISSSAEQNIPGKYYALMQPTDSSGTPTPLNSSGNPAPIDWSNAYAPAVSIPGYTVRYIIERLCTGTLPVTDIQANCMNDPSAAGGSKKAGQIVFTGANAIYYRVTVRATGPRNTVSMVQAIISQ